VKRSRRGGRRPQGNHGGHISHGGGGGGYNPNRTFDSNGPEVKIRGSAAHVHEKYLQLARDANSSGDRVMAENYLQHAEHYNRIIMAFRDQQMGSGGDMNGGGRRPFMQEGMEPGDEFGDDDGDEGDMQPPMQSQPRMDNQRFEGQRGGHDQHRFRDRGDQRYNRQDRGPDRGQDRSQDRGEQRHFQPPVAKQNSDAGVDVAGQQPSQDNQMRRRERFPQQSHEQTEFLRRPVRRPRREGNGEPNGNPGPDDADRD
jgi:hypothetical protein